MIMSTKVAEYVLEKISDFAFKEWSDDFERDKKKRVSPPSGKIASTPGELEAALNEHAAFVSSWCQKISFADLLKKKETGRVFIPLDVLLQPNSLQMAGELGVLRPLETLIEEEDLQHLVILGHPGAGKTTSLKHLCLRLFSETEFLADSVNYPVLVQLRELNPIDGDSTGRPKGSLVDKLCEILSLRVELNKPSDLDDLEYKRERLYIRNRILRGYLDSTRALLLLDGLDEISTKEQRDALMHELRGLTTSLKFARVVLTSRTGEFGYYLEGASLFEIHRLTQEQIVNFAEAWLGNNQGSKLLEQIKDSPYNDTTIRPLTLAHLCAIYERTGKIPDKPKSVYRKIVNLLLRDWDEQRSVKRETAYANFDSDRKFEFLSHLAFTLTLQGRSTFETDRLRQAYAEIHQNFSLPIGDATRVARELESHTGLFIKAGYEKYEFSHKSLQEFLAAEHLVRLGNIPMDINLLLSIPNELAIAAAISSQPSDYISLLARRLRDAKPSIVFMKTFLIRLFLERPDFEKTPSAGVGLLSFYSKFIEAASANRGSTPFPNEILTFEEVINARVPPEAILNVFREDRSGNAGGKRTVILRKRKKSLPADADLLSRLLQYELPSSELCVSPRLIGQEPSDETLDLPLDGESAQER